MDLTVAEKAGVLEAGDQAQHTGLVSEFQVVLETNQVVGIGAKVFLTQLHYRMRGPAGARVTQTYRLHGPEA